MTGFDFTISKVYKGLKTKEFLELNKDLPPIFKLFVENFDWSDKAKSSTLYFLPYLKGGEIQLSGWNYREIFSKPIPKNSSWMEENGFICIATSNKGIYLGTKGKYKDKIFSTKHKLDDSMILIADNFMEFVRGLTDNISSAAESKEEYKEYMIELGYEDDDLEEEILEWVKWKENIEE